MASQTLVRCINIHLIYSYQYLLHFLDNLSSYNINDMSFVVAKENKWQTFFILNCIFEDFPLNYRPTGLGIYNDLKIEMAFVWRNSKISNIFHNRSTKTELLYISWKIRYSCTCNYTAIRHINRNYTKMIT